MHLLVTGANGFIGRSVCSAVSAREGFSLTALSRRWDSHCIDYPSVHHITADIETFISLPLRRRQPPDAVIHLAACAHKTIQPTCDELAVFRNANRDVTLLLARWAASNGVRRFVYVSSIAVNGNTTVPGQLINESSPAAPRNAYAISKLEAEEGLWDIGAKMGLEICIVRPPLVYGPMAPGNFCKLVKLLQAGIPLPFASLQNRRSFIYVENLADALIRCATQPEAANELFVICDSTVSTPELLRMMAAAMGLTLRLFPLPLPILRFPFTLARRTEILDKLTCNLEIDASHARHVLRWRPHLSMKEALLKTFVSK